MTVTVRRWRKWLLLAPLIVAGVCILAVLALRVVPPPTTAFMLASDTRPVQYDWTSWQQIAPVAALAVVASEDQKFPEHWGFDFEAIDDAIDHNKHSRRLRGASTISQQTAKNLFLWSGRSYVRKGLEVGFTLLLEGLWPKRRILETYLNVAEFGPGVFGVEAASRLYFHEPARHLNRHQAALLAAVLPNPQKLRVDRPSDCVETRAGEIEQQMEQLGFDYLSVLH